jgi:hypothetical protein
VTPVRGGGGSKDSVNLFLKNASRLTSIEEAAAEGSSSSSSGSSGSSGRTGAEGKSSSSDSATLTSVQRQLLQQQQQLELSPTSKYPNIDFLENDASLWDAFFLRSKTSGRFQSVLRPSATLPPVVPPPLPVEEYLRFRPQRRIPIHDADSLRTLLPQAHKHLLAATATSMTQTCQSMSGLKLKSEDRSGDDPIMQVSILITTSVSKEKLSDHFFSGILRTTNYLQTMHLITMYGHNFDFLMPL